MLKIGILLDSELIQAWQAESIRQILNSGLAEIPVLIINQSPQTSGGRSPFLYRSYRKLDRILFKSGEDAFKSLSIFSVLDPKTSKVLVHPIQTKYRDEFENKDLEKIKELDLDILLRFGFRILKGEILSIPKLGVWSYHHGDPAFYRGGPPAFWEVMKNQTPTSAVLMRINEDLDQGDILYQTFTQTNPLSVQRNANSIFWASSLFVSRVLKQIMQDGIEKWQNGIVQQQTNLKVPLLKPPGSIPLVSMVASLGYRNIKRKVNEWRFKPHWQIGFLGKGSLESQENLSTNQCQLWEHPNPDHFYLADPFSITYLNQEFIFAEEFNKSTHKGKIVYLGKNNGELIVQKVIEEEYHLSYPFIFEENGEIFLIPESAEAKKIYKYQCLDFPLKWEMKEVFFDQEGYDPTLVEKDGLYWLFINQKAHPACSPFDELNLYWTESIDEPNWYSHPQNPIVSDVRNSRPAGRPFQENGTWFRPAQDSGLRYGYQVQLQEIIKWTKDSYLEKTRNTISPKDDALGIHTLNKTNVGFWMDFYSRR